MFIRFRWRRGLLNRAAMHNFSDSKESLNRFIRRFYFAKAPNKKYFAASSPQLKTTLKAYRLLYGRAFRHKKTRAASLRAAAEIYLLFCIRIPVSRYKATQIGRKENTFATSIMENVPAIRPAICFLLSLSRNRKNAAKTGQKDNGTVKDREKHNARESTRQI